VRIVRLRCADREGTVFAKLRVSAHLRAKESAMKRLMTWIVASCIGLALALAGGQPFASAHGDKDAMFERMDSNHDGKVSPEEHAVEAKAMFENMDADHNGTVTEAEMTAAHDKMMGKTTDKKTENKAEHEMSAAEKIKLTVAEHEAGAKAMFDKMDTDHDGYLSKAECTAGHAKLMHSKGK
jgi:Ca2+-binding EF-hand superfamily protein